MPTVAYTTAVSTAVTGETAEGFAREVDRVLADPRGWRKYGYVFERVETRPDLVIRLEASDDADALCRARGFSCWRPEPNDIIIHEGNWLGGSASRLPLERYHNYVVTHEVGHAFGLEHQRCPRAECARRGMRRCPASVMQQMTRGPAHVSPCVETDWPLDPDWLIDDPGRARARRPSRGARLERRLMVAAFAVVIVLVLCLVVALRCVIGCGPPAPSQNGPRSASASASALMGPFGRGNDAARPKGLH